MKVLKKILKIVLIIVLVLLVLWGVANLAKFVIYPDYMQQRQNVCSIPDLNNGFIPQGITYDAESNSYIMSCLLYTSFFGNCRRGCPFGCRPRDNDRRNYGRKKLLF